MSASAERLVVDRLRAAGCVFAEDEARLLLEAAVDERELERLVAARVTGLPLEQLLGWAEFRGLRIAVARGVFVPRARTGFLVELALASEAARRARPLVVDLCCGTGAVAAALAAELPRCEVHAADVDPAEVACARRNVEPRGSVHEGDLFDALPGELRGRVDILTANAPYVPSDEIANMPSEARDHEHRVALDGGGDGLDVQRRVIAAAPGWLASGGVLIVETSARQSPVTLGLFRAAGLDAEIRTSDELDATAVLGRRA